MKLEKAIEILEHAGRLFDQHLSQDYLGAIKLLIEAGKRVKEARVKGTIWNYTLLPGETKE